MEKKESLALPILGDLGDISGKRVLVRADLNVPLREVDGEFVIADLFRIESACPTVEWLLERGAVVTLCSHLGRPKGAPDPRYDIAPVRQEIQRRYPQVKVLENLRFDRGEEENSPTFAAKLAEGQDLFVLDAFGSSHRAHASIVGVPKLLPSVAGLTMELEVRMLSRLLVSPERPYVAVIGGSKISDKLGLLEALLTKVDRIMVGGAMAFTFFVGLGREVGDSLVEPSLVDKAAELFASGKIDLPVDLVELDSKEPFGAGGENPGRVVSEVAQGFRGLDIGPATVAGYGRIISTAKSILWNGPVGVYEDPRFSKGTLGVARAVASSSAFSVIGGGDSAAALRQDNLEDAVDHISTGGGASLEFIEKGDLPGLAALRHGLGPI